MLREVFKSITGFKGFLKVLREVFKGFEGFRDVLGNVLRVF